MYLTAFYVKHLKFKIKIEIKNLKCKKNIKAYPIPVGVIFSIIQLVLLYWIFKYNLMRRSTIKHQLGQDLSLEMIEMFILF